MTRSAPGSATDAELLLACRNGDAAAWEALVRRYRSLIYGIAVKWYGLRESDACDVFQEVCCTFLQEMDSIEDPERLRSWLVGVSIFKSRRVRRHARRLAQATGALGEAQRGVAEAAARRVLESSRVREAYEQLDDRCRELIRMRFFGEQPVPYSEIARRMGLSAGSIGPIRARCFSKLQKYLERRPTDDAERDRTPDV